MGILGVTVVPFWCLLPRCVFKLPLRKSNKQVQDLKETFQLYEARLNAWYEEGCEVAPFKSGPPPIQVPPVIQDYNAPPPFQPLNIIVCRRFEPPPPRTY